MLERIYIGRRFKNDTERLEKLFDLYTKMTSAQTPPRRLHNGRLNCNSHRFVNYACNGSSKKSNELGMRVMQERAFEKRGSNILITRRHQEKAVR